MAVGARWRRKGRGGADSQAGPVARAGATEKRVGDRGGDEVLSGLRARVDTKNTVHRQERRRGSRDGTGCSRACLRPFGRKTKTEVLNLRGTLVKHF